MDIIFITPYKKAGLLPYNDEVEFPRDRLKLGQQVSR